MLFILIILFRDIHKLHMTPIFCPELLDRNNQLGWDTTVSLVWEQNRTESDTGTYQP